MIHDSTTIDRLCSQLRSDLGGLGRRVEAFDNLPRELRQPSLQRLGESLELWATGWASIQAILQEEIAKGRGPDEGDSRRRFRDATG